MRDKLNYLRVSISLSACVLGAACLSADLGPSGGPPASGDEAPPEPVGSVAQALLDPSCSDEAAAVPLSSEVNNCALNQWTFPIRYENLSSWPSGERTTLLKAMDAWKNATGGFVTFEELGPGSTATPRLHFTQCVGGTGHSPIGMNPPNGVVSVQLKGCSLGTTTHELGHTLGMIHQHQRADRDRYLVVRQNKFCAPVGCPAQGGPPASNACGTFPPNCNSNLLFTDSVVRCNSSDSMGGYLYGSFDLNSVMLYPSSFPAPDCCAGHESGCGMLNSDGTMISPPGTVSPGDGSQLLEMYREPLGWGRFRPIVTADLSSASPLDTRLKGTISLSGSPAIARSGTSDVFAFATGSDARMYVKRATNETAWGMGNWADLGGSLASEPAAVATTATQVGVVAVGTDGDLWQNWSNHNVWGGWGSLGRPSAAAISAPAIASMASNRVDVFVRSGTNLYQKTLVNGIWGAWTDRGCCIQGKPAAVSWGPGRIDIAAVGVDGAVWHRSVVNDTWNGWSTIGGSPMAGTSPAIASSGPDVLHVYVTGQNGNLWFQSWAPAGWSGWTNLGGLPLGSPSATSFANGHAHVAAKISNGKYDGVWQKVWQ